MTVVANYGRPKGTVDDPGGMGGANKVRDDWWGMQKQNDARQGALSETGAYLNGEAARQRGPQAIEDQGLSNQEASGANGHQQGAIGLAGTLARGQQPSHAAMQLQSGLNQASAQQQAMSAGARGGAALATAGQNAQMSTAGLQQNAFTQGGLLRSRDMAAGRGMLGTGLGQMQQQDQARLGQANQLGQFNRDQNDKYSLGMGGAAVGLGQAQNQGAAQDLGWYQGGMTSVEAQSEGTQQGLRWEADAEQQRRAAEEEDG